MHSAIGAEYAHVTAPLRRLVDRYASEVALSRVSGTPIPEWVLARLEALPSQMGSATQRASAYERGSLDLLEALILSSRIGEVFEGMVVATRPASAKDSGGVEGQVRATVLLSNPAVRAKVIGPAQALTPGNAARVRVVAADVSRRRIDLALA